MSSGQHQQQSHRRRSQDNQYDDRQSSNAHHVENTMTSGGVVDESSNSNNFFVQLWNTDGDPINSLTVRCSGDEDEGAAFEAEHVSDNSGSSFSSSNYSYSNIYNGGNSSTNVKISKVTAAGTISNIRRQQDNDNQEEEWEEGQFTEQLAGDRYRNKKVMIRQGREGFEYDEQNYEKSWSLSSSQEGSTEACFYPTFPYENYRKRFRFMMVSAICMVFVTIFASFMIRNQTQVGDFRGAGDSTRSIVNFFSKNKNVCKPKHVDSDTINYVELELALLHTMTVENGDGGSSSVTVLDNSEEESSNMLLSLSDTENQHMFNSKIVDGYNDVTDGGCKDVPLHRYMKSAEIQSVDTSTVRSSILNTDNGQREQRHIVYVVTWLVELSCNGCTYIESFANNYETQYYDEIGQGISRRARRSRFLIDDENSSGENDDDSDGGFIITASVVIEKMQTKLRSAFSTESGDNIEVTDALVKILGSDDDNGSVAASANALVPKATYLSTCMNRT